MKTIIACLDFSDVTEPVVQTAAYLARETKAMLFLLHSVPVQPPVAVDSYVVSPAQDMGRDLQRADERLAQWRAQLKNEGIQVFVVVRRGAATANILVQIGRLHADMVVMGSHGHGALHHLLMGSTAEQVIRKANCPVVIVPSRVAAAAAIESPDMAMAEI